MATELGIDDGAFRNAQEQIMGVHDDPRDQHRSLSDTMRSLLAGGWTGEAARDLTCRDWLRSVGERARASG